MKKRQAKKLLFREAASTGSVDVNRLRCAVRKFINGGNGKRISNAIGLVTFNRAFWEG